MDKLVEGYIENAIKWAREQSGSQTYAYRCLAFVEDAYEKGNQIEIFGGSSAKESAVEYGVETTQSLPPLGSFAFYDCSGPIDGVDKNWGHVGISLGDGQIIHAWDKVRVDNYLEIERLQGAPGWTSPRYLGWVPVEKILQGHQQRNW